MATKMTRKEAAAEKTARMETACKAICSTAIGTPEREQTGMLLETALFKAADFQAEMESRAKQAEALINTIRTAPDKESHQAFDRLMALTNSPYRSAKPTILPRRRPPGGWKHAIHGHRA